MGCVLVRVCDPPLPDNAIRDFWHINGVILDAYTSASTSATGAAAANSQSSARSASLDVTNNATVAATSGCSGGDVNSLGIERSKNGSGGATAFGGGGATGRGTVDTDLLAAHKSVSVQRRPAGVLYVYNGRLIYRSRRCSMLSRHAKPLQIDICDVLEVTNQPRFVSHKDNKSFSGKVVDVTVANKGAAPFHLGFFTTQAEEVSQQLGETCVKHRQKPKIFQFNSVDVDGVEIDFP